MALTKISSKVLSNDAVTADKIATGAITVADIPDGEITTTKLHTQVQSALGMRNRIINGNMAIDQRNNGSSNTANTNAYFVDRLQLQASGGAPVLTGQRVTDAPNDFKYSMKFTTNSTTDTLVTNEAVTPRQNIEGYNVADFNFGNANAKEFTVSFWVKGSVTGTYGFTVMNASFDRHYVTTYNINSANTWEKKTITLTADTSGSWDSTTGVGVRIMFPLDTGPDLETATTETWGTGDKRRTSSCVKLLQNSSATWQITGLQVELGDTATPFENRMYGTELALCKRYFQKYTSLAMTPYWTTGVLGPKFEVEMRAAPTAYWEYGGTPNRLYRIQDAFQYTVSIAGAPTSTTSLQYIYDPSTTWTQIGTQISALTASIMTFSAEL